MPKIIRVTKGTRAGCLGLLHGKNLFGGYDCSVKSHCNQTEPANIPLVLVEGEFEVIA